MTIDGNTYDPFSAETLKVMPPAHASLKEKIVAYSRENYAMPVEEAKKLFAEEEKTLLFGKKAAEEKKEEEVETKEDEKKIEKKEGASPMV